MFRRPRDSWVLMLQCKGLSHALRYELESTRQPHEFDWTREQMNQLAARLKHRLLPWSTTKPGVKTKEERDAVIDLGCDLLQGYLLARPGKPFPRLAI
jgi:hypothetical protein